LRARRESLDQFFLLVQLGFQAGQLVEFVSQKLRIVWPHKSIPSEFCAIAAIESPRGFAPTFHLRRLFTPAIGAPLALCN
jgi:hypothetical protein